MSKTRHKRHKLEARRVSIGNAVMVDQLQLHAKPESEESEKRVRCSG
jgi:hypothetical protein